MADHIEDTDLKSDTLKRAPGLLQPDHLSMSEMKLKAFNVQDRLCSTDHCTEDGRG